MNSRKAWSAFSLVELLVIVSTSALLLSVLMPTLTASREQARRQQCAVNQKKIIRAYALWSQDHGGFWPPRCAPEDGCTMVTNVQILVERRPGNPVPRRVGTAYYQGNPSARNGWPALVGEPAFAADADDYPLNSYLVPGWQFGDKIDTVHCPSDANTVIARKGMDLFELSIRGFEVGDVGSNYEFHGTSYYYNSPRNFPWRGYGDWAGSIVVSKNMMQGPNFNPDLIYRPGAFVAGLDMGAFYAAWKKFFSSLLDSELGDPLPQANWHESRLAGPGKWLNANAYHADGHVTFARRRNLEILGAIIPAPSAQCFITPEWSLFPLKLPSNLMTKRSVCRPN